MKKQKYVKPILEVYETNRQMSLLVGSVKTTSLKVTRERAYETTVEDPWDETDE